MQSLRDQLHRKQSLKRDLAPHIVSRDDRDRRMNVFPVDGRRKLCTNLRVCWRQSWLTQVRVWHRC